MQQVRLFRLITYALIGISVTACSVSVPVKVTKGTTAAEYRADPEQELQRHIDALTRSAFDGAAVGTLIGGAASLALGAGSKTFARGALVGATGGVSAGGYVGFLQQKYATREARLEHLTADIEQTNANAMATIQTMERLIAARRGAIAAGTAQASDLSEDRKQMGLAIAGYERRYGDFASTRALKLVPGQATGVDPQLSMLEKRIRTMREVAGTVVG